MLAQIKSFLRDQLNLPPSMVLVVGGCVAHLALNAVLRKPPTSAWGLLAPATLAVALESYELWDHYAELGLFATGNDPILTILARHFLDVLKALSLPAVLVLAGALPLR